MPYVLLTAAMMWSLGILGAAVGAQSAGSTVVPIREPGSPAPDLSTMGLFTHNAGIALRSAFGFVTIGLYTTYVQLVNGFLLGATLADVAGQWGVGRTLLSVAPHGVLELPAIWLSGAVGYRWTHLAWKVANGDRDRIAVPRLVAESIAVTGLVLGMLLAAAFIEANLSVHLV